MPHGWAYAKNTVFYDRTARWWGATTVSERDRSRALKIDAVASGPLRVLELGAGFGGAAAATADLGHRVVAIERSAERAALARKHIWAQRSGELEVIEADFNDLDLVETFDVVAYWSGFGIGDDEAQLRLLERIARWLAPQGHVFIDVFDPVWWAGADGSMSETDLLVQRLNFDAVNSYCSITCWPLRRPASAVTETIRCYRPDEFVTMALHAGLAPANNFHPPPSVPAPSYLVELTVSQ